VARLAQFPPRRRADGGGAFVAIYLAGYRWTNRASGLPLRSADRRNSHADPAGALVDFLRSKRALVAVGVVALARERC